MYLLRLLFLILHMQNCIIRLMDDLDTDCENAGEYCSSAIKRFACEELKLGKHMEVLKPSKEDENLDTGLCRRKCFQ